MLDEKSLKLMKDLMESFGPSGFEREANKILKKYMEPYSDQIVTDKLGSIAFVSKGSFDNPKILLAGHTDEVGFIVSGITKEGYISFNPLGGWWDQVLLSQRVLIRGSKGDIIGIIAAKPPHLLSDEDRRKVVEKKDMFIDIGASCQEEVEEAGIRIGDPAVPWSPFEIIQNGKVAMGKAFDDRIGAFIIAEALKRIKEQQIIHNNTAYGAATVQEEVGTRGAQTITHVIEPDVGIVLEVDIAGDVPGIRSQDAPTKMGKGPSLITYDGSMIPNQPYKEFVIDVAKKAQIPLQLSMVRSGGTDGAKIHMGRGGCPTIVIGVPTRHIHSHVGLLSLKDVENAIRLIIELIKKLDKETVEGFTAIY
ncbi:M42 family metallopeptidase [Candidatus Bathyarchaeota archaeon]|nr:M42 family metallopeptidase [Candidatus Bathyarchaeota archaeon]